MASLNLASIVFTRYASKIPRWIVRCMTDWDITSMGSGAKWLRPNRRTGEYQLKLNSSEDPKWVDLSAERLGDQTLKGIYSLDGGKLTICYAYDPDLPRPTEFKTTPDV